MFVYINYFLNLDPSLAYKVKNRNSMTKTAKQNLSYWQVKEKKSPNLRDTISLDKLVYKLVMKFLSIQSI